MQATILLVEDDLDSREIYRISLTLEGFRVVEAEDGTEALELAQAQRPGPTESR